MQTMEMDTQKLTVKIFNSVDDAPLYNQPEFLPASMNEAAIVVRGTVGGKATVDLIFRDANGQKYVAMVTLFNLRSLVSMA